MHVISSGLEEVGSCHSLASISKQQHGVQDQLRCCKDLQAFGKAQAVSMAQSVFELWDCPVY